MTRRCKHCKEVELLPAARCVDIVSKKGYCSIECLDGHTIAKLIAKANEPKERQFQAMKVRVKENKETIGVLKKKLQVITNKLAKLVNHRTDCISCGVDLASQKQIDGGHFVAVGQCDPMRFNIMNIHPQCVSCNDFKGGNQLEYERRLREIKGNQYVDYLLEQKRVASHIQGDRVWDKPALRLMIKWTNKQLKEVAT
jgi:ribosomal protein L44E